jgi:hypothetical protein
MELAVQEVTVDFVKISNVQVIGDIRKQTRDWMAEIGRHLNESAKVKLDKLWKSIKVSPPHPAVTDSLLCRTYPFGVPTLPKGYLRYLRVPAVPQLRRCTMSF